MKTIIKFAATMSVILLLTGMGPRPQEIEKILSGRYSSWNWAPDGRIIFVLTTQEVLHTGPFHAMGYEHGTSVTKVCVMNADGSNAHILHEAPYMSITQKWDLRKAELQKQGLNEVIAYKQANAEQHSGELANKIYPDPALSHIGWLDWNKATNKLVFVANDGTGKTGIAVSDPEFKEVRWIHKQDSDRIFYTRWSPDGSKIAFTRVGIPGELCLMDLEGKVKVIKEGYSYQGISWFADGDKLITLSSKKEENGLIIIDLEGNIIQKLNFSGGDPALSPSGEWVAYNGRRTGFEMINLKTGEKKEMANTGRFPKWSPDGNWVLTGWEGEIVKTNPFTKEQLGLMPRRSK